MRSMWRQRPDDGAPAGDQVAAALDEVAPVGGAPDADAVRARLAAIWELFARGGGGDAGGAVAALRSAARAERRAPRSDGLGAEVAMALSALSGELGETALAVTAAERAELLAQATRDASLMAGSAYWQARAYLAAGRANDAAWSAAEGCRTVEGVQPDEVTHGACALLAAIAAGRAGRADEAAAYMARAGALAAGAGAGAPDPWRTGFSAAEVARHATGRGLDGPVPGGEVAPQPAG